MKRLILASALGAAFATGAWGAQPVPNGDYVFTSGAGTGYGNPPNQPFTVTGFTTNRGGSVTPADACSGVHMHGTFSGFANPAGVACGHGTIGAFLAIPGASGSLNGMPPNSAAGQLALTRQNETAGELFLLAAAGFAGQPSLSRLDLASIPRALDVMLGGTGVVPQNYLDSEAARSARNAKIAREDMNIMEYGTPNPTSEQLAKGPDRSRMSGLADGSAKPPPAPAATPPAEEVKPSGSIVDSISEPTREEVREINAARDAKIRAIRAAEREKERTAQTARDAARMREAQKLAQDNPDVAAANAKASAAEAEYRAAFDRSDTALNAYITTLRAAVTPAGEWASDEARAAFRAAVDAAYEANSEQLTAASVAKDARSTARDLEHAAYKAAMATAEANAKAGNAAARTVNNAMSASTNDAAGPPRISN